MTGTLNLEREVDARNALSTKLHAVQQLDKLGDARRFCCGIPGTHFMKGMPGGSLKKAGAYECTETGVKSLLCSVVVPKGSNMCPTCDLLSRDHGFKRRVNRSILRMKDGCPTNMRHDYISASIIARDKAQRSALQRKADLRSRSRSFNTKQFMRSTLNVLHNKLMSQLHFRQYPLFVQNLVKAHHRGLLCTANQPFICDLLTGMSTALINGSRHRVLSKNEKTFYKLLLMYGGKMVHNFVSVNLLGASWNTSRRQLRGQPLLALNTLSENVRVVVDTLKQYKLLGVPCLIGEDGTALVKHLDPVMESGEDGDEVLVVYGMNGGPVTVASVEDLRVMFKAHGFATTLYVWDLIPLIDKAPHLPIKVAVNANSFSHIDVLTGWKKLWRICFDLGINIVGHVSDGDSKLRAADFVMQQHLAGTAGGAAEYVTLNHHLIQLRIPVVDLGGNMDDQQRRHPVCCLQDFLHVMWRLRVMYLKPNRILLIGPFMASPDNLRRHMAAHNVNLGLRGTDLDERDKQNFVGCLRLFGFKPDGTAQTLEHTTFGQLNPSEGMRADIMYLRFCHRFVRTFIVPTDETDPRASVRDMGYTITFLSLWKQLVVQSKDQTVGKNMLSRETYTDVLLTAMTVVLLVKVYREYNPQYPWVPRRMSSRFNEYIFSYLRLQMKGSPNFTALTAQVHLRNLMIQLRGEAASDVKFPQFKRGHTRGVGRTDFSAGQQLYWPSDDEIGQELDAGRQECKAHFSEPFGNGDTLLGLLHNKDIDKYTLFDAKSQAFWKTASDTQLRLATDIELGNEYLAQVGKGFHLPNDWRKQFVKWSAHGVGQSDDGSGGSDGDNTVVQHGSFEGSDGGSGGRDGAKTCMQGEEPQCVGFNNAPTPFLRRRAATRVPSMADNHCTCTLTCQLGECSNFERGWECTPDSCNAKQCNLRIKTSSRDAPQLYAAKCPVRAKGRGLFTKTAHEEGTLILKLDGVFKKNVATGGQRHYTLSFGGSSMPEGIPRKAASYFSVAGLGRHINSSCKPNSVFRVLRTAAGKIAVGVYLTACVNAGDEIVAAYDFEGKCLCDSCATNNVGGVEEDDSGSDGNHSETGSDSDDGRKDSTVDLTVEMEHAVKFEKALAKCVKVASAKTFVALERKQDTRTPLFMEVQEVCRLLNSSVDKQSNQRQFRFQNTLCVEVGEVKNGDAGELSDGYISVDNDVAYLFEEEEEDMDGNILTKYRTYYGNIGGLSLRAAGKSRQLNRRVQSLVRTKAVGQALMLWYTDGGNDAEGNKILKLFETTTSEQMSTDGILCRVDLDEVGTENGESMFRMQQGAVQQHEELIKKYTSGEWGLGVSALKAVRGRSRLKRDTQTRQQLREQCRTKGLPLSGNKTELINRLSGTGNAPTGASRKRKKPNQRKGKENKSSKSASTHQSVFSWGGGSHLNALRR